MPCGKQPLHSYIIVLGGEEWSCSITSLNKGYFLFKIIIRIESSTKCNRRVIKKNPRIK